jgi:hypothetical protein
LGGQGEQQPELISRYLKETKDTYQVFTSFFVSDKTQSLLLSARGILKTVSPPIKPINGFFGCVI